VKHDAQQARHRQATVTNVLDVDKKYYRRSSGRDAIADRSWRSACHNSKSIAQNLKFYAFPEGQAPELFGRFAAGLR
jgi:hypothetical protein